VAALVMLIPPALAHVTLEKSEAKPGAPYKAVFKVPHGCEGSATVKISVAIPEGVIAVKPMPKPGWQIEIEKGTYAASYGFYHGAKLAEGAKRITWSGGPLPDDYYDEFVLSTFIAKELTPGTLYFPVDQSCETGRIAWSEIPAAGQSSHDLKAPAPGLVLLAEARREGEPPAFKAGAIVITQPWSRATPAKATVAAGYLKITNTGSAPDTLLGGKAAFAERVEVHDMKTEDGVMKMRPLLEGLEIKPGETVELKPGGMHLMFQGLKEGLVAGTPVKATLEFRNAGPVEVELAVGDIGSAGPKDAKDEHSHH
jgi:uncharacterized protein YcnI